MTGNPTTLLEPAQHPAYELLDGPSGTGVQDLFTPEVNSQASVAGSGWTKDNALTQQYDSYKVQAVLNELNGYDHSGTGKVGVPAILGLNFQIDDDGMYMWLNDRSEPSTPAARARSPSTAAPTRKNRDVPLVVWGKNIDHAVRNGTVETAQIAPTILQLLGLDPNSLQAVQEEHTPTLPLGWGASPAGRLLLEGAGRRLPA